MKQFFKERLIAALEKALEGAERGVWPVQNAPQHKGFLENLLREAQRLAPHTFHDWHKRALEVANLCGKIRDQHDTYYDAIRNANERIIECTGQSHCRGHSENEYLEFPEAYMLLTDEEILGEEKLRVESEKRRKAEEETERKRIVAEMDEKRERALLKQLQEKYGA